MSTVELVLPSMAELQGWAGTIFSTPGLGAILLILLVYFGLKALIALFETVEEILVAKS